MNTKYIKEAIKLVNADSKWWKSIQKIKGHSNRTFYIFGGPVHGNLGDHAIMEEEKLFVKYFFPEYDCEELLMPFYHTHKAFLKEYLNENDIVCVSGGGWMGDLWFHNEVAIREIIDMFPNNQIVIFPQTLYYSNDLNGNNILNDTINHFAKHKNLLLCVRDLNSLNLVKSRFVFSGISSYHYCPDMVLFGGLEKPKVKIVKMINLCIRDDCESVYSESNISLNSIIPEDYLINRVDTVVPHRVKLKDRRSEIVNSWELFSKASLTVTDRLHGMLFSYINGTPCIALDNKTGKVFGVEKWIDDKGMVFCASSLDEISKSIITKMLAIEHIDYNPMDLRGEYSRLAERIKKGMRGNGN